MAKIADLYKLYWDKGNEADGCIEEGFTYTSYCDYLAQFNYGGNHMVPISQEDYKQKLRIHTLGDQHD